MQDHKQILGLYNITNIDENGNSCEEYDVYNTITNEGISLIARALLSETLPPIDWKFRVGTGRDFTLTTDSYEGLDQNEDKELITADVGSEFFKKNSNQIILNGIVLSSEGFIETIKYDADNAPRENIVTVGHNIKTLFPAMTGTSVFAATMAKIKNQNAVRFNELLGDNPALLWLKKKSVAMEDIKIQTVEINSWLADIDDTKKWNNVSLIARIGTQNYLFSRVVLPPMFKAKGIKQVIKYTILF